jgi:N-acetylmuramoyl-L-alanine amidase
MHIRTQAVVAKPATTKKRRSNFRNIRRKLRVLRKKRARYLLLGLNIALLSFVGFFITRHQVSHTSPLQSSPQQAILMSSNGATAPINPLDELSAADIAVHIARMTQLETAVAVTNQADSAKAQLSITPAESTIAAKPQIVSTDLKSKDDIVKYVAVDGDSVESVAQQFGITTDSVRWSNGLSQDALQPGQELYIPPVNGIVYVVKEGDSIDSLAERYSAPKNRLIVFNDAEVRGLVVGERIVIPDGVQPAPVIIRSQSYPQTVTYGITPQYRGNGYIYGWCTWHAANRRMEIGRPIPSNLGNAITWYSLAQRSGLATGAEPRSGAVLWHARMGGLGHVAYVERVNDDGSLLVSDMNYPIWGRVTYRTVPPSEVDAYRFIY